MTVYLDHLRTAARLLAPCGEGREGKVHRTSVPGVVVKVFAPGRGADKLDKLEQMAHAPLPAGRFAWPLGPVRDGPGGRVIGFAMAEVNGVTLHDLCRAVSGAAAARGFDRLARLEVAADLADLVETAHQAGVVIGDVSDKNFLVPTDSAGHVARPARVVGIDCDSYQVPGRDPATGRPCTFPCGLGTPGFVPPELLLGGPHAPGRTPAHDRFAAAVLLFTVVKGDDAFAAKDPSGRWVPDQEELTRTGRFPYAPHAPLPSGAVPRDSGVPWARLPRPVRDLFVRCFKDGHKKPDARPTAAEWRDALRLWLAAERARLPGPAGALVKFVRGRLSRRALVRTLDAAAGRFGRLDLGAAWAWVRTGNRRWWVGGGLAAAVLVGFGLSWNPDPHLSPPGYGQVEPDPGVGTHPGPADEADERSRQQADQARERARRERAARVKAAQADAETRWDGAPGVFREALKERLEERP